MLRSSNTDAFTEERLRDRARASAEEACKLTEAGFEYVGKVHGAELFRKRK